MGHPASDGVQLNKLLFGFVLLREVLPLGLLSTRAGVQS